MHTQGANEYFTGSSDFDLLFMTVLLCSLNNFPLKKAFQACANFLSYNETNKMKRKCVTIWQYHTFPLVTSRDEAFRLTTQNTAA